MPAPEAPAAGDVPGAGGASSDVPAMDSGESEKESFDVPAAELESPAPDETPSQPEQ